MKIKNGYLLSAVTASVLIMSGCGGSGTTCCDDKISSTVNNAPEATFTEFEINKDKAYVGQLTSTDQDGDVVEYELVKKPVNGQVSVDENGLFTYIPKPTYTGDDSFTYKAKDALASCPNQEVKIHVKEVDKNTQVEALEAPSNLRLEALSTCKVRVSWTDNSTNETGFAVYLDGKLASVVGENVETTNVCGGMYASSTHTVSVQAKNAAGFSQAVEKVVTTKSISTPPKAPENLKVVAIDKTSARLQWKDVAWNETEYDIYVNGAYKRTIWADNTNVVISGLEEGTKYTFQVTAKNNIGSNTAKAVSAKTRGESPVVIEYPDANAGTKTDTDAETEKSVDSVKPALTLLGNANVSLSVGDEYDDLGATAVDDVDGDISTSIETSSTVDRQSEGNYTVTYTVSDAAHNTSVRVRKVEVKAVASVANNASIGEFSAIKTLLQASKDGSITNVKYISVGDSTRAEGAYGGKKIFDAVATNLTSYKVSSLLQAKAGHTLREWNNYNDEYNATSTSTWRETVAQIPDDGNHTIVNISLGINDARYFGDGNESVRMMFQMDQVLKKILKKKPQTHFMFTMPHKMVGFDAKVAEIKKAYETLASKKHIPLVNTMSLTLENADYRAADAQEYGSNKRIHLSEKGQKKVSDLILKTIAQ